MSVVLLDDGLGSPPRVREKRIEKLQIIEKKRITPASAGKTDRRCAQPLSNRGSPPRVREKRSE